MSKTSWKTGGACRTVCRPRRRSPQVFTAAAVGRIARYAVDDGADPDAVCLSLLANGLDCCDEEKVRGSCDRVRVQLERLQAELEAAADVLETHEESDLADAISELALAALGIATVWGVFGAVFRAWKLRNAAVETKRILEQLSRSSQEVETAVVKHSSDVVTSMRPFHMEP